MRQWIERVLQWIARRELLRQPGVRIHPTAKVNWRRIRFHPGSSLEIGEGSIVEAHLVTERYDAAILIGRNTFIGNSMVVCAVRVEVGDDTLISWGCTLTDHNSHAIAWSKRQDDVKEWYCGRKNWESVGTGPVSVGPKSWLGLNVVVLRGVQIGEGAIVGAGSVVTRNVSPWTLCAGNPAKQVRAISIEDR